MAGVDLRCGAGRLGLQSAPSALPRALGFNSHLAIKYTPHRKVRGIFYGGDGGSRTRVRKHFNRNFSGRRRLFTFPCFRGSRHPRKLGSFIVHGALKALRTHVHHLSTLRSGPWSSRRERSLIKQREELRCRCSLIYKGCPFYGW